MTRKEVEHLLELYSFDELVEHDGVDLETLVLFLITEGMLSVPEVRHVDDELTSED